MKLAYREFGQGQALIILHGLFGQSDNWNSLAKQFAEKGFHVFAVDQRNHGLSPHSDEWTYESMAQDVKELIDDKNLEHPILLGHSMGGKTVLFFEKLFPGLANKLIIVDIAARAYEPHHQKILEALWAVDFDFVTSRKEAETTMNPFIHDTGTKQFLLKNIFWKNGENSRLDWRFNLPVISKNIQNIGVEAPLYHSITPTLIIKGANSNYISNSDIENFQKRFTNCELCEVLGAGHWVHAEKPKEFYEAVGAFITKPTH